jgi:endonuclease YncB( thermonuclease family)
MSWRYHEYSLLWLLAGLAAFLAPSIIYELTRKIRSWKRVYLKKATPLDDLLRERPARHRDHPFFKPNPHPRPKPLLQLNLNLRSRGSAKIVALAAIVAFALVWGLGSSPWPVTTTLRHIAFAPNCGFSACAQTLTGTATIIDADTIVIRSERIRLRGVDAPETDQICLNNRGAPWNCGIDARDQLIRHIGSRETSCITNGQDAFGRWLATCSTNEGDLSAWLVREGFGLAFIRYSNSYVTEEAVARSGQKGMWAGAFIAPWDWRTRTARTAILGSYKPTEDQKHLLLPSIPQSQPKQSLSLPAQLQERRADCLIKGNISSSGGRIYHMPGQRYYDKTQIDASKGERWFCTEQEALAAGWRKAKV